MYLKTWDQTVVCGQVESFQYRHVDAITPVSRQPHLEIHMPWVLLVELRGRYPEVGWALTLSGCILIGRKLCEDRLWEKPHGPNRVKLWA